MSPLKKPQPLDLETDARVYEGDRAVSSIEPEGVPMPCFLAEAHSAYPAGRTKLAGLCFLVVEDEPLIGLDLVAGLEDAGARTEGPVATVEEGIEIIEGSSLDGVLLDANLKGRPVNEILSALIRRNVPFVFVTGYGRDRLPPAFRAVAVLAKPFTREQVLDAAAQLLRPKTGC